MIELCYVILITLWKRYITYLVLFVILFLKISNNEDWLDLVRIRTICEYKISLANLYLVIYKFTSRIYLFIYCYLGF